jgi:ribonuclease Z
MPFPKAEMEHPMKRFERSSLKTLCATAVLATALAVQWTPGAAAAELKVTLLGTGTPVPTAKRFSQSILVEAGAERLVFDLGRGVTIRLAQRDIRLGSVTAHFITHMHSDHLSGFPDLWLTGWLPTPFGSRKTPMVVYGPKGTEAMTANLTKAFSEDIRIRIADELLPPEGIAFDAHDIVPGPVYSQNGVSVSAFKVDHGELIRPSYGYVVEYDGKKVVITGDTKYDERIVAQSQGADLLIHEVADVDSALMEKFPRFKEITAHHTTPEEAGRIFTRAKPRLAVYTHILALKPNQALSEDLDVGAIVNRTRMTYKGPLTVGSDLMTFIIGQDIKVLDGSGSEVKPGIAD